MATGINRVIILGRCGQDPEVKNTPGGLAIVTLSLATSESWTDKTSGEKMSKTEWHNITFFGKLGELIGNTVKKGSLLYVEGKLVTQKWDDKKTGEKRSALKIHGDSVQFLDSRQHSQVPDQAPSYPAPQPAYQHRPTTGSAVRNAPRQQAESFNDDQDIPF